VRSRPATGSDLEDVTATLTAAFAGDPLWRWAFGDMADLASLWRLLIGSALRYPWVRMLDGATAVALWIPPGGTELTDEEEARLEPMLPGPVLELLDRFDQAHPREQPHYYLSLLGTRPQRRGQGLGMGLLAECLAIFDAEGVPTYLESSNPANDGRYERIGYRKIGSFTTPDGAHTVATMWREPSIG
jgi:ribosomal protein S18 acetylase RimI-like enzyme